jgi:hypothetical protein
LWITETPVGGHHEAQEPDFGGHGGGGREVIDVPVARQEHARRHGRGHHPISIVARPYGGLVSADGDIMRQIGSPPSSRSSQRSAGRSGHLWTGSKGCASWGDLYSRCTRRWLLCWHGWGRSRRHSRKRRHSGTE